MGTNLVDVSSICETKQNEEEQKSSIDCRLVINHPLGLTLTQMDAVGLGEGVFSEWSIKRAVPNFSGDDDFPGAEGCSSSENQVAFSCEFDQSNAELTARVSVSITIPSEEKNADLVTENFFYSECDNMSETSDVEASGSGTYADPFIICFPHQINTYVEFVTITPIPTALLAMHFRLGRDLDFSIAGVDDTMSQIGNDTYSFTGSFDGNGYTMEKFAISVASMMSYGGIFAYTENATIKNLVLNDVNIGSTSGVDTMGVLVGWGYNTLISRIRFSNSTVNAGSSAGGLVGVLVGGSSISDSGLEGTMTLNAAANLGGLVSNVCATCSVLRSYSLAPIASMSSIGGLAVTNEGTISNSYAGGNVNGTGALIIGGIVGFNSGSIVNTYYSGAVTGTDAAGIAGDNSSGSISGSYYNTTASAVGGTHLGSDAGTFGRSEAQMRQQATYAGWDFSEVWNIVEDSSFPFHRTH